MDNFYVNIKTPRLVQAKRTWKMLIEEAEEELKKVEQTQSILCKKCGKRSQAQKFRYSIRYWYEEPHSCNDGDTWHHAGFYLECPKCKHIANVYEPNKYSSNKEIERYDMLYKLIQHGIQCENICER